MAETSYTSKSRFQGLLITNVVFTDDVLGRGSDASVYAVEWNGTVCAAKRLHEILLEDESPGGADKLISNFEAECLTWSKLRHPGVVQFLGVYLDRRSRLPVLVMEKMDTSLRKHLENHSKEQFPLHQKVFVLRQVAQALAYLHNQKPPLVHHDLSSNNVLLNTVSYMTKVSDFGMSRAINPFTLTRKSSIKGTLAFMPPEALQKPLRYDTKLDVFSFGNLVISTLTHEWPEPQISTMYEGGQLIALSELQRREHYISLFTAQEKQLFLPIVCRCLANRPEERPSSAELVQELRHIESSIPADSHFDVVVKLRHQLSAKVEECKSKDEVIKEKDKALRVQDEELRDKNAALVMKNEVIESKDDVIRGKDEALQHLHKVLQERDEALSEKDQALKEKDEVLREKDVLLCENEEESRRKNAMLRERDEVIKEKEAELQRLRNERKKGVKTTPGLVTQFVAALKMKHSLRKWREVGECQRVIQHRPWVGLYRSVAVNSEGLVAVTDDANPSAVHLLTKEGELIRSIGKGLLGSVLLGVAFDLKGNVWVTDCESNKVIKFSQDGHILQTLRHAGIASDRFNYPSGVCVSQKGLLYICDRYNHRVTVHEEDGKFLFSLGSKGQGPGCFNRPIDITVDSDGLAYVTDGGNERVCVWSKEGTFQRDFKPKFAPTFVAATSDKHLIITSYQSHTVMVYTLGGELIHEFGGRRSDPGKLCDPRGICVDEDGLVFIVDWNNKRVQVF